MSDQSPTYKEEKYVTWDEVQEHCRALAQRILDQGRHFEKMLVITRGGMAPASVLARELEIHNIENICVATYDSKDPQKIKEPRLLKAPLTEFLSDVLVVDDLADTGTTLKMIRNMTTNPLVVTIFAKPAGESLVDLFQERVAQNVWVRFPWDTEKGSRFVKPLAQRDTPRP